MDTSTVMTVVRMPTRNRKPKICDKPTCKLNQCAVPQLIISAEGTRTVMTGQDAEQSGTTGTCAELKKSARSRSICTAERGHESGSTSNLCASTGR